MEDEEMLARHGDVHTVNPGHWEHPAVAEAAWLRTELKKTRMALARSAALVGSDGMPCWCYPFQGRGLHTARCLVTRADLACMDAYLVEEEM